MAVETLKSTFITNRDATPTVPTDARISGGAVRASYGYVTVSGSASATSTYPLASIPSNARVTSLKLQTAALGAGCAAGVGVSYPTEKGGAAIAATFFAAAVDVSAAVAETQIKNQSGTNTIALQEKELWSAIGLSADPACNLDLVVTLSGAAVAGGLMGLAVDYVL